MDILGIGIPELGFIILIALIVLGPKDMKKAGKTIGKWMRNVVTSPEWREIKNASRQMKQLPTQLMREANFEEFEQYKRDLDITMPQNKKGKSDKVDAGTTFGTWSGASAPLLSNNTAPPVEERIAPPKLASASPESPTVEAEIPIENNDA